MTVTALNHQAQRRLRPDPLFLWHSVLEVLEREVRQGIWKPGHPLPAEEELATRFGVHRNTVRRSIAEMQQKGLIRGERGRGNFVREIMVPHVLGLQSKLSATLTNLNEASPRRFIGSRTVRADSEKAALLNVAPGSYLKQVDLELTLQDRPISITSNYFPPPRFHGIDDLIRTELSITRALDKLGVTQYSRREKRIRAVNLTKKEAEAFGQSRSRPAIMTVSVNVDQNGEPIHLACGKLSSSMVEMVIRFDNQGGPASDWPFPPLPRLKTIRLSHQLIGDGPQ